jgi:xylulokinase
MAEPYLIGVDLGTSATKAALYRLNGTLVAEGSAEVPLHHGGSGIVEQDHADFYRTAAETVRTCITASGIDPRSVAAIGFDSQMAGVGGIDDQFEPVGAFDSWLDMRCQPYIEQIDRDYGDRITRLTGCPPTCDHGPKIMWRRDERPAEYARIAKFLMPAGYVAGRMAGLRADQAFIDNTFIHFSALSDAINGSWSAELCGLLGIDQAKLPTIVSPAQIIGHVTDGAARDFGLVAGTPIAAGAGDTAAGALGAGVVRAGMLLDTAGTASVLAGCTDQFVADVGNRALLTMRSVVPGLWHPLAYIGGGGLALRWFRDQFAGSDTAMADDLYTQLAAEAEAIAPGADGLFFSPHLGGRICPSEPAMRGAWIGFSWGHTRAHFFRAILESVGFEYAYYLDILRHLIPALSLNETRVIGGGAQSTPWNQIKADVLGVRYQRLARTEFATWGAALIAGHGVGLFPDLAQVAVATTALHGAPIMPRAERTTLYRDLGQQYVGWQVALKNGFHPPAPTGTHVHQ